MAANVAWGWHLLGLLLVFVALGWWVRRDLRNETGSAAVLVISVAVQLTGLLVVPAHQRRHLPLRLGRPRPAGRDRSLPVRRRSTRR